MAVELGPYPLCARCKQTNGGLVSVRHRQIHVRAHGQESCVDQGLARLIANLWEVCHTSSACEDSEGRAYVVACAETIDAGERRLTELGLAVQREGWALYFEMPAPQPPPPVEPTMDTGEDDPPLAILHRTAAAVAAAASRLDATLPGVDHGLIKAARDDLDFGGEALTRAMDRLTGVIAHRHRGVGPVGMLLLVVMVLPAVASATWLAALLTDRSVGWMTAAAFGGCLAALWPIQLLLRALDRRIGRARVARMAPATGGAAVAAPTDGAALLRPIGPELDRIRSAIVAARRAVGAVAWGYLTRGRRRMPWTGYRLVDLRHWDAVVANLAAADLALRLASDAIVHWLDLPRG
jgi:hypothetical protein